MAPIMCIFEENWEILNRLMSEIKKEKVKNEMELMGFEPESARWESRMLNNSPKRTYERIWILNKVEIILEQKKVAFLSPSKICE